jgi:hypothetical protein
VYGAPIDESRGGAGLRQRGEGPEGQLGGEQEQQEDDQHGRRGVVHILRTIQLKPDTRGIKRGKFEKLELLFLYNSVNFMAIANGEILYILLDRILIMAMKSFC